MTTIAYRNGVMASDSRGMRNDCVLPSKIAKLFRLKDGSICAVTGDLAQSEPFVRWLDGERTDPRPSLPEASVIQLREAGRLIVHETNGDHGIECEFIAFGSGMAAAIGAMHMGADAAKAVEIAMLVDPGTGGDIVTMSLPD